MVFFVTVALNGFLGVFWYQPLTDFFSDYGSWVWRITFVLIMMLAILLVWLVWFILSTSSRPDSVRVRILHEMRQSLRHKYACGGIFCAPTWNAFGATVTHYHSLTHFRPGSFTLLTESLVRRYRPETAGRCHDDDCLAQSHGTLLYDEYRMH